jgi:chitin disaccharide deacetylase
MKNILDLFLFSFFTIASLAQTKTIQERLGYPKDTKLLIIHADDLGISHSENSASIFALEKGSVNSASIMVSCPGFPEIAAYAQSHPQADFGVHITLNSEWKNYKWGPVTPIANVPGLVNEKGFLYSSLDSLDKFAKTAEVEEEIRNQVKRSIQFGIDPTHLDAHMFGVFSRIDFIKAYIKVGHEFKIPVFLPRQLNRLLWINLESFTQASDVIVDTAFVMLPADFKKGSANYYRDILKNLKPGLTYIMIHAAYDDDEMKAITVDIPDWGSAWRQGDFDFFTSAECVTLLRDNKIVLITWREIRDKITRK